MKIDLNKPVMKYNGEPLMVDGEKEVDGEKVKEEATFFKVVERVIDLTTIDEKQIAKDKVTAFKIGLKLYGKSKGVVTLTTEQIAYLKGRMEIFSTPMVYGRFLELIGDLENEVEPE